MEPLTPRPRQKEEICRHHDDDHRGDQYEGHDHGQDEDHVRMEDVSNNMEEGMLSVTVMILIMRCFVWQFTKVVFFGQIV